ncbi:hypothetical protein ACIREM_00800 [Streptomyces shenzhenensis]|uniref:hypothetical protein n=1 Tax=Streptomyces shenzhenensis TaxID=943815 RepID=UPI00380F8C22
MLNPHDRVRGADIHATFLGYAPVNMSTSRAALNKELLSAFPSLSKGRDATGVFLRGLSVSERS